MKNAKIIPLNMPGFQNSGNYCDPVTGECYGGVKMENVTTIKIDPVCQMEVEVESAVYVSDYADEKYYFCSAGCQREFEENPSRYLRDMPHE